MKKAQKGFTLIELMIVVAVIGVLSAIAIPKYQDFAKKGAIASGVATLSALKTNIEDYMASNGSFPADAATAGAIDSAIGTVSIDPDATSVAITFTDGAANGQVVTLARETSGAWVCSYDMADLAIAGCSGT